MIVALSAAVALFAAPQTGDLQGFMTGASLEAHCQSDAADPEGGQFVCLGYLAGSWDQLLAHSGSGLWARRSFCPPPEVTLEDLRLGLFSYLDGNPEQRESAAALVVERAAVASFPCETRRFTPMALRREPEGRPPAADGARADREGQTVPKLRALLRRVTFRRPSGAAAGR